MMQNRPVHVAAANNPVLRNRYHLLTHQTIAQMKITIDIERIHCPHCKESIGREEFSDYSPDASMRLRFSEDNYYNCPHCKAKYRIDVTASCEIIPE